MGDDFDLHVAGTNPVTQITGIELGFVTTAANANIDILVDFYRDLDFTAGTGVNIFGTQSPVASYRITIGNVATTGAYTTGMLSLGAGFALPAISNYATMNHGIDLRFVNSGTNTLNTASTVLFRGDAFTIGASEDVYWRDANGNGTLSGDEARVFGGAAANQRANFYMKLEGTAVPEPATMAVLGLGAAALLRRRRK